MTDGWGKYGFVNDMGEEKEENQGNFENTISKILLI